MSRSPFPPRPDGHLTSMTQNRDLQQKLTYQQLLNLNHDLSKENMQLKKISERLGIQLNQLHLQFEIKPREENSELYNAIGNHPVLHNFQTTLIPLFEAYEQKNQNYEHNFETIYEEFTLLQKKFEQVTRQNQNLKLQLTDKIKQNIELYKNNGTSQKLGTSDFSQLILQQLKEKQKILIQENSRLETQYQRYKSEAEKNKRELIQVKANYEDSKNKLKQIDIRSRNQQGQLKISKQNCFTYQQKNNHLESQKNKLEQALERAQSQINQLIKQRDFYLKKYDQYRAKMQSNVNFNSYEQNQDKVIEELNSKIAFLEAEKGSNQQAKKYQKIREMYDTMQKENINLKETIEEIMMKKNQLSDHNKQLEKKLQKIETQMNELSINESKLKIALKQLTEKQKSETERLRKQQQQKIQSLQNEWQTRFTEKERRIEDLEEDLEKLTLEKYNLQKQNQLIASGKQSKSINRPAKDSQRLIEKMTQKMNLNKDILQQKIDVLKNENQHLKRDKDSIALQNKSLKQEIKKLRQELESTQASLAKITEQKMKLTESIRRVRDQYDGELKEKQKLFHQRIEEIKRAIEDSDRKRKSQRQKVLEISRKYQNAVEQLRRMYQQENPSFRQSEKGSRLIA